MTDEPAAERCPDCNHTLATDADYASIPEGQGGHLCWRVWNLDICMHLPVDWRERALKAETDLADASSELCRLTHHKRGDGCSITGCDNYRPLVSKGASR